MKTITKSKFLAFFAVIALFSAVIFAGGCDGSSSSSKNEEEHYSEEELAMQEWDRQQAELSDETVEKKMLTTGQAVIGDLNLDEEAEETPENSGGALLLNAVNNSGLQSDSAPLLGAADNGGLQSNDREIIEKGCVRLNEYHDMSYKTYYKYVTEDEGRYPVFDDNDPKTTNTYKLKVTEIKTHDVPENFVERYNNREFKLVSGQFIDFNDTDILVTSDNLKYIGKNAFTGLKKLQMVVLRGEPSEYEDRDTIGESAFENCSKLWYAGGFSKSDFGKREGKIILGNRAFANCATNSPETDNTLYFDCGIMPELPDENCAAPFEGTKKIIGIAFIRRKAGLSFVEQINEDRRLRRFNKVIKPWGCDLSDDTLICDLSIPGSHDSATYKCENTDSAFAGTGRTQELSLSGQWKQGVRFFDLRVVHPTAARVRMIIKHGPATCYRLYDSGKKVELTLYDAIKEIADEVYQSGDFAIIQIIHQNEYGDKCKSFKKEENHEDYNIGDRVIQEELAKWKTTYTSPTSWQPSYKNVAADYKKDLRVRDLRGKILFIHNVPNDYPIDWSKPFTGCWGIGLEVESENDPSSYTFRKAIIGGIDKVKIYIKMQNLAEHVNAKEKLPAVQAMFEGYAEDRKNPENRLLWGFNYTSGYIGARIPNYQTVAAGVNGQVADIINGMSAGTPIGFTIMDFAGAPEASRPASGTYKVNGDKLLDAVIKHNFK